MKYNWVVFFCLKKLPVQKKFLIAFEIKWMKEYIDLYPILLRITERRFFCTCQNKWFNLKWKHSWWWTFSCRKHWTSSSCFINWFYCIIIQYFIWRRRWNIYYKICIWTSMWNIIWWCWCWCCWLIPYI